MKSNPLTISFALGLSALSFASTKPFHFQGTYAEGCACPVACSCDLNGAMAKGCNVIGVMMISKGKYGAGDLSGCNVSYIASNGWVKLYYQVAKKSQVGTLKDWTNAYFSGFGKVQSFEPGKIAFKNAGGSYTLSVNDGKTANVQIKPMLGGDGKKPIVYSNYPDPMIPVIMQGKTVSGAYKGTDGFALKDSNAFFNPHWKTSGKI